jgi:hypothetical protein
MLHVTNGDSAGGSLRQAGLPGDVMAWKDVLCEGPVPAGLSVEALRATRAHFIAQAGWGYEEAVSADLLARDTSLAAYAKHEEVVLWFEHDLYDQLQLLQILDRFVGQRLGATRLSLICLASHPDVDPFYGLGQLSPAQLAALFPSRVPLTTKHCLMAQSAWEAFRSPDPRVIVETVLARDTSVLPFLRAALQRHLEEFPAVEDGLSRTERQILECLAAGERHPGLLFQACQQREEAPFLGDTSFFARVRGLTIGDRPLLAVAGRHQAGVEVPTDGHYDEAFHAQDLVVTEVGQAVLAQQADWVALHGTDRWLGGVRLSGQVVGWRWSRQARRLVQAGT